MSVGEADRARHCTGHPGSDDPHLPQDPDWPEGLGGELREQMGKRWDEWLHDQYSKYGVKRDSKFGLWLEKTVACRQNAEWASIQRDLAKRFAPSIQVMCSAGEVGQWWMRDDEP